MDHVKAAFVVHSHSGLDEVGVDGPTTLWRITKKNKKRGEHNTREDVEVAKIVVHPESDFGVPVHPIKEFAGETPEYNASLFQKMISGETTSISAAPHSSSSPSPSSSYAHTDFLLVNASVALVLVGKASTFKEGVILARKALCDNSTKNFVMKYISHTQTTL